MAKKDQIEARPGLRLLVNREGTKRWDELEPETVLEWFSAEEKQVLERFRIWYLTAKEGDKFIHLVNRLVVIELV